MIRSILLGFVAVAAAAVPASARPQAQDACDCEAQRPATLAVVNNISIPTATIETDTADLVGRLKSLMDKAREQALQKAITDRLLQLEATKRGITATRLIQDEIVTKAGEPTDQELRDFYDRNAANMGGKSFAELQESLRMYVRSQRQQVQMTILTTDLRTAAQIQILEYSPTAPATEADRAKVLATVNGTKITSGDLEDAIRPVLFGYRHKVWEIERDALDGRIDDVLIDQEARRRGTTVDALTAAEIAPKAKKIDVFDASKFYNDNKDQFGGRPFTDVRDDLVKFLRDGEVLDAKHAFAAPLRKTATIKDSLVEPVPPSFEIAVAGRPSMGAAAAPVTIVVFSDFECPRCKAVHGRLDTLAKEYAGKVRIVARNYPLEQHILAHKAAEAAEAAAEQGKYWEYADLLFANQGSLTSDKLKQFATQLGLDRTKFDAALDSGRFAALVDNDLEEGTKIGVQATPSLYVNGRQLQDDSEDSLKAAVEEALKPRG